MKHLKVYETYSKDCDSCEDESPRSHSRGRMSQAQHEDDYEMPGRGMDRSAQRGMDSRFDSHDDLGHDDYSMDHDYDEDDYGHDDYDMDHDYDEDDYGHDDYDMDHDMMGDDEEYQPKNIRGYDDEMSMSRASAQRHDEYDDEKFYTSRHSQAQREEDEVYDSYAWRRKLYERKKAKPDFLDFDKDGNKKEAMKKALKDKEKSQGRAQKGVQRGAQKQAQKRGRR